jgi:ABC-type transport system involved in Fe-S cluster assembly fused permease/ATPase subunit
MVLVTHDLALLPELDEVVVLDGGRVLERGTHSELLIRSARYRQMWEFDRGNR